MAQAVKIVVEFPAPELEESNEVRSLESRNQELPELVNNTITIQQAKQKNWAKYGEHYNFNRIFL